MYIYISMPITVTSFTRTWICTSGTRFPVRFCSIVAKIRSISNVIKHAPDLVWLLPKKKPTCVCTGLGNVHVAFSWNGHDFKIKIWVIGESSTVYKNCPLFRFWRSYSCIVVVFKIMGWYPNEWCNYYPVPGINFCTSPLALYNSGNPLNPTNTLTILILM